jgi:hypothetical protein
MTNYSIADNFASFLPQPSRITGQYLARAHLSRQQRAELAAALVDGSVEIFPPTVKQAAILAGVPAFEVSRARHAKGNGHRKRSSPKATETLAEHIMRSSLAERIEAARAVGVDLVWDSMVSPLIATAQAAAE